MFERIFTQFANAVSRWTGKPAVFLAGCFAVIAWSLSGPVFHYSNTWQLVINTGTTIVTFLMVFLIQRSQNKDSRAVHLKLNELVALAADGVPSFWVATPQPVNVNTTPVPAQAMHFRKPRRSRESSS